MATSLSSRALLFIALVAALLGCAFAHRGLLHSESKECAKAFPGCSDCDFVDGEPDACLACADDEADVDSVSGECVCQGDYGTITKAQVKEYKHNNKYAEEEELKAEDGAKHNGLAYKGACVDCTEFDLVSVDGVCEESTPI